MLLLFFMVFCTSILDGLGNHSLHYLSSKDLATAIFNISSSSWSRFSCCAPPENEFVAIDQKSMFNLSLSQYIHTCFLLQGHRIHVLSVCATWKRICCSRSKENVWSISLSVKSNLFPSLGTWQQPTSTSPPPPHPVIGSFLVFHLKINLPFKIRL